MLIKVNAEQLAVARVLESLGWSHRRIALLFSVDQSTITYGLRRRKVDLPAKPADVQAEILAAVMDRIARASRKAIASELRVIVAQLEADDERFIKFGKGSREEHRHG